MAPVDGIVVSRVLKKSEGLDLDVSFVDEGLDT